MLYGIKGIESILVIPKAIAYSNDKNILLLNISGKITVAFEEEVETVNEFELLEIPAGVEHVITCLQDAQIFVVKL